MDTVYPMNNLLKAIGVISLYMFMHNSYGWVGWCNANMQGPNKVCMNQSIDFLLQRTGGDELGSCRWSDTPGITEGFKTVEGCEATFTGAQEGEFWITGSYEKQDEYKCHDATKVTVVPDVTGAACCEIKDMTTTPADILPRQSGNMRVPLGPKETEINVTLWSPAPAGGCSIEFNATTNYNGVGGHNHDTGNSPIGDFSTQLLNIPEGDSEGSVTYRSSFVSGGRDITANIQGFPADTVTKYINVRVGGLNRLFASTSFRLTGSTTEHVVNHYGLPSTNTAIATMADSYLASHNATIGINDMSLIEGGLFDISGNWGTPHRAHRKGTSVDIDRCALVVGCPASNPSCNVSAITCSVPTIVNGRRTAITTDYPGWRNFTETEMTGLCTAANGYVEREPTHHCEYR